MIIHITDWVNGKKGVQKVVDLTHSYVVYYIHAGKENFIYRNYFGYRISGKGSLP